MGTITKIIGSGTSGIPRAMQYPASLGMWSGGGINALVMNDQTWGTAIEAHSDQVKLDPDEWWSSVYASSYHKPGSDTSQRVVVRLELTTNKGRQISGGTDVGDGLDNYRKDGIRVVRIGGRSDYYLNQITLEVIEGYAASSLVAGGVTMVYESKPPNSTLEVYSSQEAETSRAYQKINSSSTKYTASASISAEYAAKVSAQFGWELASSETEQIDQKMSQIIQNCTKQTTAVPAGSIGLLVGSADIFKDSDGHYFSLPADDTGWVVLTDEAAVARLCDGNSYTVGSTVKVQAGLTVTDQYGLRLLGPPKG